MSIQENDLLDLLFEHLEKHINMWKNLDPSKQYRQVEEWSNILKAQLFLIGEAQRRGWISAHESKKRLLLLQQESRWPRDLGIGALWI